MVFLLLWPLNFTSIFLLLLYLFLFESDFRILLSVFSLLSPPFMPVNFSYFTYPCQMCLKLWYLFSIFFFFCLYLEIIFSDTWKIFYPNAINNYLYESKIHETQSGEVLLSWVLSLVGAKRTQSYYFSCMFNLRKDATKDHNRVR